MTGHQHNLLRTSKGSPPSVVCGLLRELPVFCHLESRLTLWTVDGRARILSVAPERVLFSCLHLRFCHLRAIAQMIQNRVCTRLFRCVLPLSLRFVCLKLTLQDKSNAIDNLVTSTAPHFIHRQIQCQKNPFFLCTLCLPPIR